MSTSTPTTLTGAQISDAITHRELCGFLRSQSDRNFADSLLSQLRRRGSLSPKQWPWVAKLATRASMAAPRAMTTHAGAVACGYAGAQTGRDLF
jgi:hypothetical protein